MFWSSNGWRSRNHSFHFCKVYVSLTARILTRVVVSQLEHERRKPRHAFRCTFQINSLFLDTAWGYWLLKVGGTKISRSWGKSIFSWIANSHGLLWARGHWGRKAEPFLHWSLHKTNTKALLHWGIDKHLFSVFQEFKVISRNFSVILGNYKPHRKLTFSYTAHRGWTKSVLFFPSLQRYFDMGINHSVNWVPTCKQVPKQPPQQNPNKFP